MKKKIFLLSMAVVMFCQLVVAQTTNIKGLTVILNYKDNVYEYTPAEVSLMMNQTGFNGFGGMLGSIKDYFYTQTNGKYSLTSEVISITMPNNLSDYYAGGSIGGPTFLTDVATQIQLQYPNGFTGLSINPANENRLWNVHFLSNTAGGKSYAFGNSSQPGAVIRNNGVNVLIGRGNISMKNQGSYPPLNVMAHEMGHSYFDWADYYATAFCNLGDYDVMGGGGTDKAPMPVNPGLRLKEGWITNVVNVSGTITQTYTVTANNYSQIHKYTNPNNPKEYLLFQALKHGGYYQPIVGGKTMDQGLAIWYVNEDGAFDVEGVWNAPYIRLVQADNKDEMHDEFIPNSADVRSDLDDLYDNVSNSFPNGTPFRWKDGGEFGISITNISTPGTTMTFTVNARPNTVLASSDRNGTLSPKGTLSATSGESKIFSFIPNLGYEIDVVKVDGNPVTVTSNSYTLSGINGTKTIHVTYKKKANINPLPSPWKQADIGFASSGLSAYESGKFNIESYGNGIYGGTENFRFVYQTFTGDGSIVAKIDQSNVPSWNGKFGLMIRESLQPGAVQSMIGITPLSGIFSQQRSNTGASVENNFKPQLDGHLHTYLLHNWLKIDKVGNEIISYCSRDNIIWVEISRQTLPMGTPLHIGMFVTGANGSYASKAMFNNVSVTLVNTTTAVSITSPVNNATYTAGSTVVINATAVDANGVSKVDFYNGNTIIGTDNTAPYSYTWTNVLGKNTVYVKATNNLGVVTKSSSVIVNTPCNFTDTKFVGTVIGTPGSWGGSVSTRDKAFDGDIYTYFDGPESVAWAGLSMTQPHRLTGINFYPREEFSGRMVGGKFQGSNTVDFSTGVVDLAVILEEPTYSWNCISVSTNNTFKYFRYISPVGGVGNVAEIEFYGIEAPANVFPEVSITSPATNAVFNDPATITITANASDADGAINVVEFYNGNTLIGSDFSAPYSYTWSSVISGTYSITAIATDNQGAVSISAAVSVTVNANIYPTVSITSPVNGTTVAAPATVTITANAADANGTVTVVGFYNGNTLLGADYTAPYSYTWSSVAAGSYSITARATDNLGAISISDVVTIVVEATTPGNCITEAIPNASQWIVRNSWNDQNSGSTVVTTIDALNVKHRQWGNADLTIIETGKSIAVVNGQTYAISFDFKNDAATPVTGIDVGLATGAAWNGAALAQPAVAIAGALPASYTTKTVTITATTTGTIYLAFKFKFNGQPANAVNVFVKNISVCSSASNAPMNLRTFSDESSSIEDAIVTGANPFSNQTTIKVLYASTVPLTVVIKDVNGITVWEASGLQTNQLINIGSGLPIGNYIVNAYYAGTSNTVRLIKY